MNPSPPDTPALSPIRTMNHSSPSRMSIDSPHTQTQTHSSSPFLHNLTQRLRKGSNASSHSGEHPASPQPLPPHDPITKTESSRAARRMLFSMVRDDWDYPSTTVRNNDTGPPAREPVGYRLRDEWQSDIEAEEMLLRRGVRSRTDPYRFENPDDVGTFVAERLRKRRRLLEDEMQWNEGLRTWAQRRDAWTGAVRHKPIMEDQVSSNSKANTNPGLNARWPSSSSSTKRPSHKSRLSHTIRPSHERDTSHSANNSPALSPQTPTSVANSNMSSSASESSSVESNVDSKNDAAAASEPASGPWLPIFPPILSQEDVLRDRIKPQAYATIYSKVVVQSMTPNVPIPLKHMIPALVEGWKSEGNWPPQAATLAAQDLKKGRQSSTFSKWRREHHFDSKAADHTAGVVNEDGKSRVRRSISMMRKVLGGVHSDDGLGELGIEFCEQDEEEMRKNITLNQGLLSTDNGHGHKHGSSR
ncbi:hypothetical protein A1O1_07624 [Capronia coronata CBS 617.96]|uniref:Gag1-like clamp domain-containing protein n=1 Tax=Capronia coronata CBS 617.96 TaxID=1182541 RepID=W9XW34_9EURO|nr:uncharacterized protein A1O1_07624 [Capronia coronata CBS 617.96]EXJ81560.1 hypothetical protein A1O1_07624 [Capronia coronata CBS 617.96]